jgi:hypothetical protein
MISAAGQERRFPWYISNKLKKRGKNLTDVDTTRKLPAENLDSLRGYATPGELTELAAFQDFLTRFVKIRTDCTVQCMLLWTEWVRFYKKKTREFPALILEKDFRDLVTSRFSLTVSEDESRGFVYRGLKFVPETSSFQK